MVTDGILATLSAGTRVASASGSSPANIERFQQAYSRAREQLDRSGSAGPAASGAGSLLSPLMGLNTDSTRLAAHADRATQAELRPGELMMLTMRSHEFLFHCELVANVANRSSDGVQQLFRQQS